MSITDGYCIPLIFCDSSHWSHRPPNITGAALKDLMILVVDHLPFASCRVGAAARTRTGFDVHFNPLGVIAVLEGLVRAVIYVLSLGACG